jgi:hypothetical protein
VLGEQMRREGLRILTARYASLANRASRRMMTPIERKDIATCETALAELQAMERPGV